MLFDKSQFESIIKSKVSDLVLKNLNIVDVNTGTIYEGEIAISSKVIIGIGKTVDFRSKKTLNIKGRFAVPAFMDAHMHLEPTLLLPAELSKLLVPHGVLTLFADLMEVANVFGVKGIDMLLSLTKGIPLRILVEIPSRVPTAKGLETTGGELSSNEIEELLKRDYTISLGELNFQNLFSNPQKFLEEIRLARKYRKIVNGHAPHLSGNDLYAYHLSGISDDHESTKADEALEKLRIGMSIMVREGSTERNLDDLVSGLIGKIKDFRRLLFCTDDKFPNDIINEGHIDYNVKRAIELGLDPITAIQMATINIARHFKLDDIIGSLSVGRYADILILDSLENVKIRDVFFEGQLVYSEGKTTFTPPEPEIPEWALKSINIPKDLTAEDFLIRVNKRNGTARVVAIELVPDQIINERYEGEVPIKDHYLRANTSDDIIHISVVNRYTGEKKVGNAFVRGFNIKDGAIASSFAHDHHNIVVVGDNPEDMLVAVKNIEKTQGGLTVVSNKETLAHLELPLGGLISLKGYREVIKSLSTLNDAVKTLGCKLTAPFMQLQFVTLPSVPKFGISDYGLIDSQMYRVISPIISF
ncbi:MAG: adenine deaminase [Candidatus Asgardarchaeia archaeon]